MHRILAIAPPPELLRALETHRPLAGAQVDSFRGNVEALQAVRTRSYDVAITDPESPMPEDLAVVRELRRLRPALRAIVLAPAAAPQEIIQALRDHVFACYTAPFNEAEIAGMVIHALEGDVWRDGIEMTSGLPYWLTLRVSSHLVNAERLTQFMKEYRSDLPDEERGDLMVAFREVLVNAMEHGTGFDAEKRIEVSAARTHRAIVYHFRDSGPGFDPKDIPQSAVSNPPDKPLAHLERRAERGLRPGGFGILIAKQLVDEMVYNERGNEVLLIKYTDGSGGAPKA
jgi:anti-sigma regulatory factor (Ser/Thr protein kinase)